MLPRFFLTTLVALSSLAMTTGCHDGPMYALKYSNPYWVMKQWREDEMIGVTDHQRWTELKSLASSIANMPAAEQQQWTPHLQQIYSNDASPEMRRLAVYAAGQSSDPATLTLVQRGLDDESLKVQMEACRGLGNRSGEASARLLATTLGKTQDRDVRHAAIAALAQHPGPIANDALKLALKDRDPATQDLVMESLRETTGKDYGTQPDNWVAALEGKPIEEVPSGGFPKLF